MDTELRASIDASRRVAERYCAAWSAGDLEGILGCYAEDFTLHYFGANPFTGDHVGRDRAVETLLAVGARAPRRLVSVDDVLAGPGSAAVIVTEAITVDGVEHEVRRVLRYRIVGDHFTECWLYEENQTLIDRAWSPRSSTA